MPTVHQAAVVLAEISGEAGLVEALAVLLIKVRANKSYIEEI
jgi:hypothetical protein